MLIKSLLCISCLTLCSSIQAGDMGDPKSWSGWYVGGHLGAGWNEIKNYASIQNSPNNPLFYAPIINSLNVGMSHTFDPLRFGGGVHLGVNYDYSSKWLVGIEVDYSYFDWSQSDNFMSTYDASPTVHIYEVQNQSSLTQLGTLRPRVGYHWEDYLPYVTAGGAVSHLNYHLHYIDHQYAQTADVAFNNPIYGWVIGAGLEYYPLTTISMRVEYLYTDFGSITRYSQIAGSGSLSGLSATLNNRINPINVQTIQLSIQWHFL